MPKRVGESQVVTCGGCIARPQEELVLTRRGVPSKRTPLRVGVERNLPKIVQLQRVGVDANCVRCCRPTRVQTSADQTGRPPWRATILMTKGRMALQSFRAPGRWDMREHEWSASAPRPAGSGAINPPRSAWPDGPRILSCGVSTTSRMGQQITMMVHERVKIGWHARFARRCGVGRRRVHRPTR